MLDTNDSTLDSDEIMNERMNVMKRECNEDA
jgi:hypothetical protein